MRRAILIFAVLIVPFVSLAACGNRGTEQTTLRKGTVQRGNIDEVVSATGAVFPEERASLTFRQIGTVTEVHVDVGDHVSAGDVLARIDGDSFDIAVRQA